MKKKDFSSLKLRKKTISNFQNITGGAHTRRCYTNPLCPLPPHEPEPLEPIPNPDEPL